jgi:hypothetical protein
MFVESYIVWDERNNPKAWLCHLVVPMDVKLGFRHGNLQPCSSMLAEEMLQKLDALQQKSSNELNHILCPRKRYRFHKNGQTARKQRQNGSMISIPLFWLFFIISTSNLKNNGSCPSIFWYSTLWR